MAIVRSRSAEMGNVAWLACIAVAEKHSAVGRGSRPFIIL